MSRSLKRPSGDWSLLAVTVSGLAIGGVARLLGAHGLAEAAWAATAVIGALLAAWWVVNEARQGRIGVDVIALAALVGTLVVGEYLAGALIAVMLTTGRGLESWAVGRAERELHALLDRAPKTAHRYVDGRLLDPPLEQICVGDRLLVRPGEVVPVDGTVFGDDAVLDESALTGEPMPVQRTTGEIVRAGAVNAGGQFDLVATTIAAESTYAGIVRLVEQASAKSSPFVRTADRFALLFLSITTVAAGAAGLISGELSRAVDVLVVATPCPLILAAPVAIVAGLSRAARRGVVVKGGAALEALAGAEILLLDKTGTLTRGRPELDTIFTAEDVSADDVLRLAASLDQVSPHVLAASIVRAANDRHLELTLPSDTEEIAGVGLRGRVGEHDVRVGKVSWIGANGSLAWVSDATRRTDSAGFLSVWVAIDGAPAAALILTDPIRPDAARTIRRLRRSGIRRVVMVTGDREAVAGSVGAMVGLDAVEAEQSPADKVDVVRRETASGSTIMVGDGINDAPALALATVGVAVGASGATASSETADVVLTVDRLDRLGEARLVGRRSRSIATQSVVAGMAMSLIAMGFAAAGLLPATWGALLQEVIDVTVILNALRAMLPGPDEIHLGIDDALVAHQFSAEHLQLRPSLKVLRDAAEALGASDPKASDLVADAYRLLVDEIEPHERDEDRQLYPMIESVLGGSDPTSTMSRAHAEISRLINELGTVIGNVRGAPLKPTDVRDLQRLLYGLYGILELHFAQEDESYLSLADPPDKAVR
jgi:heavy metal translocating P-type ATPase